MKKSNFTREEPPDPANRHDREEGASREEEEEGCDFGCSFHACIIAKGKSKVKNKKGKSGGGQVLSSRSLPLKVGGQC